MDDSFDDDSDEQTETNRPVGSQHTPDYYYSDDSFESDNDDDDDDNRSNPSTSSQNGSINSARAFNGANSSDLLKQRHNLIYELVRFRSEFERIH